MAIRFILSSLVLFATLRVTHARTIARDDLKLVAATGVVGFGISVVMQFVGMKLTNAANGALVTSASPAFIVLFAALILHESLTRRKASSLLLAMVGVFIVINPADSLSTSLPGNLALLSAALTWGLYSVMVRVAVQKYPTLSVSAYAGLAGAIFTTLLAPFELSVTPIGRITPPIMLGVLYLALIATALAILGAGVTALFFFAQPVAGALLGWLFLHEQLGANFFVGGALILIAVGLATQLEWDVRV